MKALVTGSAGFVGRHMTAKLIARGYDVVCVDPNHHYGMVPGAQATRSEDVRRWWNGSEGNYIDRQGAPFDLVVHCAAVVGGRTMIDGAPLQLAAEDLSLDAELFRWLLRLKQDTPPRVVYYSSSAAYPVELQTGGVAYRSAPAGAYIDDRLVEWDINPTAPRLPDATYGWVKLTGERLAAEANALGIPVHVFRPFSGYGADQDLAYPFPAIMERIRRQQDPLTVWGPGGACRDWVHIDDVVAGTLAWVDSGRLEPVNLCTGVATPFVRLAGAASVVYEDIHQVGYDPTIVEDLSRPTGVFHRVGDPTLMAEVFTPTVTLTEGIRRALTPA